MSAAHEVGKTDKNPVFFAGSHLNPKIRTNHRQALTMQQEEEPKTPTKTLSPNARARLYADMPTTGRAPPEATRAPLAASLSEHSDDLSDEPYETLLKRRDLARQAAERAIREKAEADRALAEFRQLHEMRTSREISLQKVRAAEEAKRSAAVQELDRKQRLAIQERNNRGTSSFEYAFEQAVESATERAVERILAELRQPPPAPRAQRYYSATAAWPPSSPVLSSGGSDGGPSGVLGSRDIVRTSTDDDWLRRVRPATPLPLPKPAAVPSKAPGKGGKN
ncbi:MAG: hypothetical protein WC700_10145 [Gemmatimonadaceae bacterium]|jgi:hypothetical protein